jgi:hypothetical protein
MLFVPALLALCLSHQSCSSDRDIASASFDTNKTKEGGASATINSGDFGWNIMNELNWGIGGYGTQPVHVASESSGDNTWLPYGYPAAPAPSGGWSTSNMIELVQKGYKNTGLTVHMNYLETSQKILYNYKMADGSTLFGGLGPYIAYGFGGKAKGSGFSESSFGGQDGYKRFDAGLQLGVGYYLNSGVQFSIGYDLGLANTSPAPDFTSHNRSFSFAIGYSLPKIIAAFKGKK